AVAARRQGFELDIDRGGGILGEITVVRDRHGDGLPHIADLAPRNASCVRGVLIDGLGTSIGIWPFAMRGGRSSAVSTAWTPGITRAADASIERIVAWACGLRTKQACSAPASLMSSTKRPRPVSSVGSSRRATRAPKCFAPMVGCPEQRNAGGRRYTESIALQSRQTVR